MNGHCSASVAYLKWQIALIFDYELRYLDGRRHLAYSNHRFKGEFMHEYNRHDWGQCLYLSLSPTSECSGHFRQNEFEHTLDDGQGN